MKKVLLTAMTLVGIATSSVFGMYGNNSDWIDFLVHGNQMRARMDQFGVTIGNGTIKGTVGFKANTGFLGSILRDGKFQPTVSAGIGYTSPMFGIGLGYNFNEAKETGVGVHTPVLAINAMNDNLRIAAPVSVASESDGSKVKGLDSQSKDYLGISTEVQVRYYTGFDPFNAIRLYVRYGQNGFKAQNEDFVESSFGIEGRFYFLNMPVGNVQINPFVKVRYDMALEGNEIGVKAGETTGHHAKGENNYNPYKIEAQAVLGITANSDVVSLYVEPALGYAATVSGKDHKNIEDSLTWGAYGEIYVTPVKDLEWYFEANVGNSGNDSAQTGFDKVYFESSTGITWYLPSFNNAQ